MGVRGGPCFVRGGQVARSSEGGGGAEGGPVTPSLPEAYWTNAVCRRLDVA